MGAEPSAYAALGLDPGASTADVERAYKRLIKQHHPDRAGGDAVRASEINRAYRQLRPRSAESDAIAWHEPLTNAAEGWGRTVWAIALLIVLGGAAAALTLWPQGQVKLVSAKPDAPGAVSGGEPMDDPLALAAIDAAVLEASRLAQSGDEMALAARSRRCFGAMRSKPTVAQFDRCVAFDEAVIRLQDRDPLRNRGPFGQIAVTGRQWNGAAYLSGDYVSTDSRLRRIRGRVELLLAPVDAAIAEAR